MTASSLLRAVRRAFGERPPTRSGDPKGWFTAGRAPAASARLQPASDYVGILEVHRFAALRRDIGATLANQVLARVAEEVSAALCTCQIGRTGRTTVEFAFRAADRNAARAALEALVVRLSEPFHESGLSFDLAVQIGAAAANADGSREEVLDHAAAALAETHPTRRPIHFAEDMDATGSDHAGDDVALMRDLARALSAGELRLHYQPKLRCRENRIDAAEALLRWEHPDRGPVATDRLIRLAESTGAIHALTDWVLAQAIRDQHRLCDAGHDLTVYINVSAVLLPDHEFVGRTLRRLDGTQGRIGFEVTETAVIQDPEGALANLRAFAAAGVKIAIDDYGSGLSSLSYLKQLPAHELKIDRMFVSGLIDSARDPLLVRSSIDLAHALEMEVTAEGVDDSLALSLLRVMGCDLIQGYLLSPPLGADELITFLNTFDASEHAPVRMFGLPALDRGAA